MKTCLTCGLKKEPSEFYKHPKTKDRLCSSCKSCNSAYSKKRNLSPSPEKISYDRKRWEIRKNSEKYRLQKKIREAEYRARSKPKIKCRTIVIQALKIGLIRKLPCEICGSSENIQAHHDDYSKPLQIRWFCAFHHRQLHGIFCKKYP
jgi:hypothetical protein